MEATCNQVIDTDLIDFSWRLLQSSCVCQLALTKSFALWTGTGRLTRQGRASPRRPWLVQLIKHKRCQQTHEERILLSQHAKDSKLCVLGTR